MKTQQLMKIRPFQLGDNLQGYAVHLAHTLFEGITRDTGDSYTTAHLQKVAEIVEKVTLLHHPLRDAAIAAGWLHDAPEDVDNFEVIAPVALERTVRQEGVVYLNDLLKEAGDAGEAVCGMVDLMTHRPGVGYWEYVDHLFSIPAQGTLENTQEGTPDDAQEKKLREWHIFAGLIKIADRKMNMDPDERRRVDDLVEEYFTLRDADEKTLKKFYRKTKTSDAFRRKGSFDFDSGLLVETLLRSFHSKQHATALDNLTQYLPLAEQRLLVDMCEQNNIFHWRKLRRVLKETYIDSLQALESTGINIYTIRRMGMNRKAPEVQGYTRILKEIRNELANAPYK